MSVYFHICFIECTHYLPLLEQLLAQQAALLAIVPTPSPKGSDTENASIQAQEIVDEGDHGTQTDFLDDSIDNTLPAHLFSPALADSLDEGAQRNDISLSLEERSVQTDFRSDDADGKRSSRAHSNAHVVSMEAQCVQTDFMNGGVHDSSITTVWLFLIGSYF
jgi:hypothetical protein